MFCGVALSIIALRSVLSHCICIFLKKPVGKNAWEIYIQNQKSLPTVAHHCMICEIIFGNGMMQSFFTKKYIYLVSLVESSSLSVQSKTSRKLWPNLGH